MDLRVALGVACLVLLAGCGFLGGGGTATPTAGSDLTPAATPTEAAGTPTATATPVSTPTPTATATPENFARRTVRNESLGARFDLAGDRRALASVLTGDVTGFRFTRGGALTCARATPFVAVSTNRSVADVAVTMDYDESRLPEAAREDELAVFVYNRTVQFYLEMETAVDAANDTATASTLSPGQAFTRETENGTETLQPELDGTRLDNAFVVMHAPTFWEAYRTGEVPGYCTDG